MRPCGATLLALCMPEYYQVGGWTELRLDIVRGVARGAGSPGPH